MKITYLHQYFLTPVSGGGTRSYEFARRLVAMGHDVTVVTAENRAKSTGSRWRYYETEGVKVHAIAVEYDNKMSYWRRIWSFLTFAILASLKAARQPADVIFATSTPLTIVIPALVSKFARRVPFVFEARDLWPEIPISMGLMTARWQIFLAELLERTAYRFADHVVGLSPAMTERMIAVRNQLGVSKPDDSTTISNCCDNDMFGPRKADRAWCEEWVPQLKSRQFLLYAGTLGMANGVGYLVDVIDELRKTNPDICLLIVGTGAEHEQLINKARNQNLLDSHVVFTGAAAKQDMPKLFASADLSFSVFIDEPSLWNNSANKFFDTLASGTPVCINQKGWLRDLVQERELGLVIPPSDSKKSAELLAAFLTDHAAMTRSGANARQTAEGLFDRDAAAAKLEAVLKAAAK